MAGIRQRYSWSTSLSRTSCKNGLKLDDIEAVCFTRSKKRTLSITANRINVEDSGCISGTFRLLDNNNIPPSLGL